MCQLAAAAQKCCSSAASSTLVSLVTLVNPVRATSQLPHAKLKHPSEQVTQNPNKGVKASGKQEKRGHTGVSLNQM